MHLEIIFLGVLSVLGGSPSFLHQQHMLARQHRFLALVDHFDLLHHPPELRALGVVLF